MATSINQSATQAGDMLGAAFSEAADLADLTAELQIRKGESAALVARTQGLAEVQTQQRNLEAATALGTNPNDASYMLSQLAGDMRARYQERDQAILATQKAANTNLFVDGIGNWLTAQASLEGLVREQDTAEARYQNAKNMYADVNNLTQESAVTNNAIAQTKSVASVEAAASAIATSAQIEANAAKIQGLQLNARGIEEAQNMKQKVFDNNMRLQGLAMEKARFGLAQEEAAERRKAKAQNQKDVTTYLGAVNLSRQSMGLPLYDEQQMRLKAGTQAGKLELDDWFEKGLITAQTGKQVVGATPFQAMQVASDNPTAKIAPGAQSLLKSIGAFAGTQMQAAKQAGTLKTAKEVPAFTDKIVAEEAQRQLKNVGTKNNWYSPPPLQTLVDPELANLNVVRKLIAPAMAAGATDFQPEIYLPQALELVRKQELTLAEAVQGIAAMGRKAVAYNNGYRNYQGMGLPMQENLPMRMETTGMFKGVVNEVVTATQRSPLSIPLSMLGGTTNSIVDITDEAALNKYANQYLAGKIRLDLQQAASRIRKTQP